MKSFGVIIARFQVPELHLGHAYLIKEVMKKHDQVVILLGIAGSLSTDINPLSFPIRKKMVQQHFPTVEVEGVYDIPDDHKWSEAIDKSLSKYEGTPIIYGSRKSFIPHYMGKHKITELQPLFERSGTDIRNELLDPVHTTNFRAGIIHGIMNRPPIIYPTVDIAVFKTEEDRFNSGVKLTSILLGRKPWEDLYRFPGGFVEKHHESYLAAAIDEKNQETGMFEVSGWRYIGSCNIDDPRYRGTKDCIKTTVFACDYVFGAPNAADDIAEVKWFPWDTEIRKHVIEIHQPILTMLGVK